MIGLVFATGAVVGFVFGVVVVLVWPRHRGMHR
jgi:uncharacterized protein involved in exopolysaccharide biosynthesis